MNYALLLTALFNGAWQGAVLCGTAYLALQTTRRLNATTMFAVWSVLLGIALALPVANYAFAARPYTVRVTPVTQDVARVRASSHPRFLRRIADSAVTVAPLRRAAPLAQISPARASVQTFESAAGSLLERARIILLLLAAIAAARLAVLARDVVGMFAARRAAKRIDLPFTVGSLARPFGFASSAQLTSPCVLGFSPALIVIPEELLGAPEHELRSVVLHEREHVRRYDDVQNVLYRIVNAIAFCCPGVRLALRELALYREQICDDAAVNGIGDAVTYAMTLTGMAQWAQGRGVPVPSLIFKRRQLLHRLEVLLDGAVNHSLRTNRRFAVSACIAIFAAALIVLRFQVPVIAQVVVAAPAVPKTAAGVAVPKTIAPAAVPKTPRAAQAAPPAPKETPCPPVMLPKIKPLHAVAKSVRIAANVPPIRLIAAVPSVTRAASIAANAPVVHYAAVPQTPQVPRVAPVAVGASSSQSSDLLDALNAAGLHDLSVDQLISIRDHGVTPDLIRTAVAYFGRGIAANALTSLADHGVSPSYLESLRWSGVTGISPQSVITMMDHGVGASLLRSAFAYFHPGPSASDLTMLADHGVSANTIDQFNKYGVSGVSVSDVVRLMDRGVSPAYIAKIRRMNPRATLDDIIRLHDSGF